MAAVRRINVAVVLLVLLFNAAACAPAETGPEATEPPAPATSTPRPASPTATQIVQPPDPSPTPEPGAPTAPPTQPPTQPPALASGNISQVWANEGGDKVLRDELRASRDPASVVNSVWDGSTLSLFGARNETVSFNLVLEAPEAGAGEVDVTLTTLAGPDGAAITTRPASGEELFNYVGRDIELFYVRYLEIKGLSVDLAYDAYDERHIPRRCRRPYDEEGAGQGRWQDRPCANRLYPDIAAPLELHRPFAIPAGANQSIWGDIYIPHSAAAGPYRGVIEVSEDGAPTWRIPVELQVRDFALPDLPSARTMLYYCQECLNERYMGPELAYPAPDSEAYARSLVLVDRHFQMAHRHRISLIDDGDREPEQMAEAWLDRLTGELFTPERGYDGPGVGVGNNVYSIGTYGSWSWQEDGREAMWANADAWVAWFDAHPFATPTDYFLYLIDESDDYEQIERWSQWLANNPGPGQRLMSMATIDVADAVDHTPSLDIAAFGSDFGPTERYQAAADAIIHDPGRRFFVYNGTRPATGSFATEDEGVALRELAWVQFKKEVDRWFYWEATAYVNYQCYGYDDPVAQVNVYQDAHTYGCYSDDDEALGRAGWNYFNGDGVLVYPGADAIYPEEGYGLLGPIASLRLKHWRRGVQDVDYLTLAAAIDPERTAELVRAVVPRALWEYGVEDPEDPTWVRTDISWPADPDIWEAARAELADIIEGASR